MNEQQLAAVKQVFKDLKWVDNWIGSKPMPECVTRLRKAITALQSIISQDALNKMAENARELGLDYEPAVQEGRDWSLLEATQESLREHMAEIKRLKAAQPAPLTCKHEWFRTGAMEPGECRCINCGMWNTTTPPAPQPVPVKTYSGGKPWPVQPKPWVGLTDEDIEQGHKESWVDKQAFESAVWWAEKKLKEKNT